MKSARPVLAAVLLLLTTVVAVGLTTAVATAATAPWVQVQPATGLVDGSLVHVSAGGFAPHQELSVIECDSLPSSAAEGCPAIKTVTTDSRGRVQTAVRVPDTLIHAQEVGAGTPVYCRGDGCRIFLAFVDDVGEQQGAGSRTLRFKGSPATITVTPSTDLKRLQWVTVRGTAFGAEGHTVGVREHVCYDMVQDTDCYGDLGYRWTKVQRDGTFKVTYLARRFVPASGYDEPIDCAGDPFERLGDCSITAVILDRQGNPDDSFGYAEFFGDPRGAITFATN